MGKSWMGFRGPILQAQKSHPNPQSLPAVGSACLGVSASLAATAHFSREVCCCVPRVLPQGGEAEPTSHPQLQEPSGLRQSWGPEGGKELKMG